MKTKLFFLTALLSAVFVSCNQDKEADIDYIKVIYCTPYDLTESLPLEIVNTPEGWQAKYVGASSKEVIRLKPRFILDEYGDSIITFEEYVDEKLNGSYTFSRDVDLFPSCQQIYYVNAQRKDTVEFYARVIEEAAVFIDERNAAESMNYLIEYSKENPPGTGSDCRDVNLAYLFHTNPKTFTYKFKNSDEFSAVTSEDGMLRIISSYCWTGGNGMGSSMTNLTAQYKTNNGIVTLDGFSTILYCRMPEFDGANFPNNCRLNILQATLNGKKHYLIEAVYSDPVPMFFDRESQEQFKTDDLALFAYTIEKGKLVPSNILEGQSVIELVSEECGDDIRYKYDDKTKQLQIPVLNPKTHAFTGQYRTIQIGK